MLKVIFQNTGKTVEEFDPSIKNFDEFKWKYAKQAFFINGEVWTSKAVEVEETDSFNDQGFYINGDSIHVKYPEDAVNRGYEQAFSVAMKIAKKQGGV